VKKKVFVYLGIGIVSVILILGLVFDMGENSMKESSTRSLDLDFSYLAANSNLKETLGSNRISMSMPIKLQKESVIEKYCSFFQDESKQELIEFCTSTELLNSDGKFLGNIHMVGSPAVPKLVVVIIQTDPLNSDLEDIKLIFRLVIEDLICNCWEDKKPDGFVTINAWVDGLLEFHTSDVKPHSQSKPISLEGKILQIELTTNFEGYLWELLIAK